MKLLRSRRGKRQAANDRIAYQIGRKLRRHHNNKGHSQIKSGQLHRQVADMAYRLNPNRFKKP